MGGHVRVGDLDIWTEQVGEGPDVLLIGGGGDTVESWQFQLDGLADRYRLTAFDNRGAGRTAMPGGSVSAEMMADDAAGVLRALDIRSAHVAGFSGGSIISQELALRNPDLVRSLVLQSTWPVMDAYLRSWLLFVRWLVEVAPEQLSKVVDEAVKDHQAATLSSVISLSSSVTFSPSLNFAPASTSATSSWPLKRRQRSWAASSSL